MSAIFLELTNSTLIADPGTSAWILNHCIYMNLMMSELVVCV